VIFEIGFTNGGCNGESSLRVYCLRLILGDFTEHMEADSSYWSKSDYEMHWFAELNKILETHDKGALITSMHKSKNRAIYRDMANVEKRRFDSFPK
jgi:hypothetical protein